ncbi:MAG: hypothetical protein KDE53_21435 [Caldilineaceae bacterium]|nr:hypothetical protein [Caldilineaceae bacterium]
MRRAAKVDTNHSQIVTGLRAIFGPDCVLDLSAVGRGCPDICVGVRGKTLLMEIKTPTGKLTSDQVYWHRNWGGQKAVVTTLQEALDVIEQETT